MAASFGKRVLQARLSLSARLGRQVTQGEVAAKMGVTGVTVSRWEADLKEPTLETIAKLAKVLGVEPSYLAFGELAPVTLQPDPHLDERVPDETVRAAVEAEAARTRPASKRANGGRGPRRA